jgi:choline dehydrogenase-like flavoprotein
MKILIIGSGPVGATFARVLWEGSPASRILMIDAGPRLGPRLGSNVKNLSSNAERVSAQIRSQGPAQWPYPNLSIHERAAAKPGQLGRLARPGTHLVTLDENELSASGMPAAAMSTNVGGMGAHWTCACPRPGNGERIPFISESELDAAFDEAERLLCVSSEVFPITSEGEAIEHALGRLFNSRLPATRQVRRMPLACRVTGDARIWSGADTILGPVAEPGASDRFELRSETICRRLITRNDRVIGAVLEHLPTREQYEVQAGIAVVAADSLRTPQLLWASGIRPRALGHHLNDHMWTFAAVSLYPELVSARGATTYRSADNTVGVFQVPFHAPDHPFHGQVMHMDVSPVQMDDGSAPEARHVVGMGWSGTKEIRYQDCVSFSEDKTDFLGMPAMQVHYELTATDRATIEAASHEQSEAAEVLGTPVFSDRPLLVPCGTSLHYQGSIRMGAIDDGESVCDSRSRVWGFSNLFVGGNGVIPAATACNPTLTSVALAVRSARHILEVFQGG